jgi:flagellar biosynthesis protein
MSKDKTPDKVPEQTVVALQYDLQSAPKITAKGRNLIAEEILRIAEEHQIPIYSDPQLVRLLATIDLGDEVPEALYIAVAEVIAFAYRINDKLSEPT